MNAPQNVDEVRLALGRVMADVHNGTLETKVATAVVYAASALLKAIEVSDLEVRLKRLEEFANVEK
jgi:hypothetical protein